jgi:hypothetical protein
MRRKDRNLLALARKKKKLAPPFQAKVEGGNARSRPDRTAMKRQDGGVARDWPMERQPNLKATEPGLTPGGAARASQARRAGIPQRKDGGDTGGKWIGKARASMERRGTVGSLRKAMGAKEGQKIPTSSLQAKKAQAERTGNTKMMRKVNFALNVRK